MPSVFERLLERLRVSPIEQDVMDAMTQAGYTMEQKNELLKQHGRVTDD